ncbi:caffeine-induced death protein-like protein [Xylogone sp. PMI_703]|nr:caffeine-induced death protein-like protein [Xylogone sp. PMI_703]
MFSSSQDRASQGDPGLEDRLRGLILNNARAESNMDGSSQAFHQHLPPHMMMATPAEKQAYIENAAVHTASQQQPSAPSVTANRKRLNQAQRRQLNSQFAISIDTRQSSQPPPTGNRYAPFSPQGHSPWSPAFPAHQSPGYSNQSQHLQSSFSPPFQRIHPSSPAHRQTQLHSSPQTLRNNYQTFSPTSYQPPDPHTPPLQPHSTPQYARGHYERHQQVQVQDRPQPPSRQLFYSGGHNSHGRFRTYGFTTEELSAQSNYLEALIRETVPTVEITMEEIAEKEAFRVVVERACRESIADFEIQQLGNDRFDASTVQLKCFGSLSSGFAIKASDMDLALLTPHSHPSPESSESHIPRLLEKRLLEMGIGARLLSRTRVPIIKLCEKPTEKLMADLLQERAKWESGNLMEEEDDDELKDEDVPESSGPSATTKEPPPKTIPAMDNTTPASISELSPLDEKAVVLKQKENQSLSDYFTSAKRLLRKLGGRDYSPGASFSEDDFNLIHSICKALISGLSDKTLVNQLRTYQTVIPLFDSSVPTVPRSLLSTFYQIEGEQLCMAWESRPVPEPSEKQEFESFKSVEAWRSLQNKIDAPLDPYLFNKRLHLALDQLKKIASLKLVFLDQGQHEDVLQYQMRTKKLIESLKGQRTGDHLEKFMHVVATRYILGVRNRQIREKLQDSWEKAISFNTLCLYHRLLQLAADYEHALKSETYNDSDRLDIEQYITLLRNTKAEDINIMSISHPADPFLPTLLTKVRNLPEPAPSNQERDRYKDHLAFPKSEVGIQCDINFSAHLALHNTQLLRCYSLSDPRVRALVLFVKAWAQARGINTPYRGTLSSYGYVLMVLHYLVNICQPFVCPNLQLQRRDPAPYLPPKEAQAQMVCNGRDVQFWRNEAEIKSLSDRKLLNHNHDSAGTLLRGFFEYFAQNGPLSTSHLRGFDWGREVLSLRTPGGILTKVEKGWVGARTVVESTHRVPPATPPQSVSLPNTTDLTTEKEETKDTDNTLEKGITESSKSPPKPKGHEEVKEIRHRYLFAIEDPFELDHNVARTVTHQGIVAIRDEFRRAWRIIKSIGKGGNQVERLLDPIADEPRPDSGFTELLNLIEKLVLGPSDSDMEAEAVVVSV